METVVFGPSAITPATQLFSFCSLGSHFQVPRKLSARKKLLHCVVSMNGSTERRNSFPLLLPPTDSSCPGFSIAPTAKDPKSLPLYDFLNFGRKSLSIALFCIAVGFFPAHLLRRPAAAAAMVTTKANPGAEFNKKENDLTDHEFSGYTRRLLESASVLLQKIEDAQSNGNDDIKAIRGALKGVIKRREELQGEILSKLNSELRQLKTEKMNLMKKRLEAFDVALKAKKERDRVLKNGEEDAKDKVIEGLDSSIIAAEEEYDGIMENLDEIDIAMSRSEMMTYSIGIRELSFIQKECELLVERFTQRRNEAALERLQRSLGDKPSRWNIQKELEIAQKEYWNQIYLPRVTQFEDSEPLMNRATKEFLVNIKQRFKESREMQMNLESHIRKNLNKYGDERQFFVSTPPDEVTKGFPEIELKWMFGDKEVVVPNAVKLNLLHGWRKWRDETKANLKKELLENEEFGKHYVVHRMERILLDRDRVVSKTWYNDQRQRWEMDPMAVPYAVSKKLVEHARIRHDWAAMYLVLKGDDKEYYVDAREFDLLFEDFGGFDGLYLKMLSSGIPTGVQLMWIPFSELDMRQQLLLLWRVSCLCLAGLWKSNIVSSMREWCYSKMKNTTDDIITVIIFPIVEFIIPKSLKVKLGMAWPDDIYQTVGSTWFLQWQSEAEIIFKARQTEGFLWYFWFYIRSIIYGYVLYIVLRFMKRKIPKALGFGPLIRDPNIRKLQRVKAYFKFKWRRMVRRIKMGVDPIKNAFDEMKRVKNPPIRLSDFTSVDSMREEINEVVAFLRNPKAFQEIGARAPRGVLIVGESGTGKTSLALAIAAEAKVPLVDIKARQLEPGLWVGQSASNVRELFQTAREMAPVIIFVEDFEEFAGVRGQFIHTINQDHEAFINQLLVELDGFEKQDGVVLIATTRSLKQIDQALQRPGRMDRILHLQRPTQMERERILQIAAKETMDAELIGFVDWAKVAEKTALLRPTELKLVPVALEGSAFKNKVLDADELMCYCGWFATFSSFIPQRLRKTRVVKSASKWLVNHLGLTLTREDLQSVVDLMEPYGQISNGIELLSPPLDWTRETKFPHAVWAAGRGLTALLLPNFDEVDNIWLEPASWEGIGCTKITKANSKGSMYGNVETRSYLEKKLVFCFGSYVAAQLLLPFGEENFLSASELKQAQEISTRMVIQYGWGPDDNPTVYFTSNAYTALSMGNNHEYEMAAKVEKIYNSAYDKAKEILQKNRMALEVTVEQLLEYESLTGKDLVKILEECGGIREQEPFFLNKCYSEEFDPGSSTGVLSVASQI